MRGVGCPEDAGVVAAGQAAVGAEHEHAGGLDLGARFEQRMLDVAGGGAEVGGQLGDLAGVGLGFGGAVHRLLEARGGDQLHRPRDLADVGIALRRRTRSRVLAMESTPLVQVPNRLPARTPFTMSQNFHAAASKSSRPSRDRQVDLIQLRCVTMHRTSCVLMLI